MAGGQISLCCSEISNTLQEQFPQCMKVQYKNSLLCVRKHLQIKNIINLNNFRLNVKYFSGKFC